MRTLLLSLVDPRDATALLSVGLVRRLRAGGVEPVLACEPRRARDPRVVRALADAGGVRCESLRRAPPGGPARGLAALGEVLSGLVELGFASRRPWMARLIPARIDMLERLAAGVARLRERGLEADTTPEVEALFDRIEPDLVLSARPCAPLERGVIAAAGRRRIQVVGLLRGDARLPRRPSPASRLDRVAAVGKRISRATILRGGMHPSEVVQIESDGDDPARRLAGLLLSRLGIPSPLAAEPAQRPRVLLVGPEFLPIPPRGGAVERYVHEISLRLGPGFAVATCSPPPEAMDEAGPIGRRYLPAERYVEGLRALLERERFDLVHIFNRPGFAPAIAGALRGARLVVSLHNIPGALRGTREAARAFRRVDAIVTNGRFLETLTRRSMPRAAGRVISIPSGVCLAAFRTRAERAGEVAGLRASLGIAAGAGPILAYVGVLTEKKGVHLLPDVVALVRRRFPGAVLVIAGASWHGGDRPTEETRRLEADVRPLGEAVRLLGFVAPERIPDVLAVADVVVAPAQWEDVFPRVNIEAMAVGAPLVTSPRGGIAEAAADGRTALVVERYRSAEAYADAVCRLLGDAALRERLSREGRRLVERRFTWERTAADLRGLYSTLLEAAP